MNVIKKIWSILVLMFQIIIVPNLQFIFGGFTIIMLFSTLFGYMFNPQWIVGVFLIFWSLSVAAFCGVFWRYKQNKYVLCYRMFGIIAYFSLNHFLLWLLKTYGIE